MKKKIIRAVLLSVFLSNIYVAGQSEPIGLQKYDYVTNGDANIFQGIPNIGIPLLDINIPATGINIGISVNYTTESLAASSLISDAGRGWNLSSVGSIVRSRTRRAEDYTKATAYRQADSDVFYYNYPGGSGRFFITGDISQDLKAVHISPSNDRIALTKDTAEGKIRSFTITDTKGNSYIFDKLNINKMDFGSVNATQKYTTSGFFLSRIFNSRNELAVVIEYETRTQQIPSPAGTLQQQKVKKIIVPNAGSIEYLYRHNGAAPALNANTDADWYIIDRLILKDASGAVMNQYAFERADKDLTALVNLDKNNNQVQKTRFEYNTDIPVSNFTWDSYGYPGSLPYCDFDSGILHSPGVRNRTLCTYGALKNIILPSGGRTEYEFESHSLHHDSPDAGYYDYYPFEKIKTITYRTEPGEYPAAFTVPDGYKVAAARIDAFSYAPINSGPHGGPPSYHIYINGTEPEPYTYGTDIISPCTGMFRLDSEGTLNFTFQGKSEGTIDLYAFKKTRIDENEYGNGLRIRSIRNFDAGSAVPVKYTEYSYNMFDNPLRSSGAVLENNDGLAFIESSYKEIQPIGYTRIKVTDKMTGDYSRYYFNDPYSVTPGIVPSYNGDDRQMNAYLRSAGLLLKKEDFGPAGQPLQKTEMNYQFKEVPLAGVSDGAAPAKKINISKQSSITESYVSGTAKKLEASSETVFEDTYNNISSTKEILADGTVTEKTFLYPADQSIQKLLVANMVDLPLETTVTRNGKLVGRAETKFDDPAHLYPTSVIAYNMLAEAPVTATWMEVYDSKGNLVQTRGKNGIPVTTLWGYYQTRPIAVIAGAAYADIALLPSVTAAVNASNADHDDPATEPQLLAALENLRKDPALQEYMVSCTTYDLTTGVTNSVSANGIRTVNIYDAANRLIRVTDAAGKTLQEYQYHYKN